MRVLLLKEVKGLGHAGDIKDVAGGYATNYLLPHNLARPVTEGAVKQAEEVKDAVERKQEKKASQSKTLANRVDGHTVVFKVRTGEGDRLYGSITSQDIADALTRSTGVAIDKKYLELEHPIKALGQHPVQLKFGGGLVANVLVVVERGS
jgi:large subunit ribosomal protein L9